MHVSNIDSEQYRGNNTVLRESYGIGFVVACMIVDDNVDFSHVAINGILVMIQRPPALI